MVRLNRKQMEWPYTRSRRWAKTPCASQRGSHSVAKDQGLELGRSGERKRDVGPATSADGLRTPIISNADAEAAARHRSRCHGTYF
jgi:hypothetical protein